MALFPDSKTAAGPTQEALEKNLTPETDPKKLAQEFAKLRERFTRTTNALASAAHDLKTPLAIMNGYVELLRGEKLGPLNDRQREVLSDMHSSGHRLQHFIQDFLTFSVLETGDIKLHYKLEISTLAFRIFVACGRSVFRRRVLLSTSCPMRN